MSKEVSIFGNGNSVSFAIQLAEKIYSMNGSRRAFLASAFDACFVELVDERIEARLEKLAIRSDASTKPGDPDLLGNDEVTPEAQPSANNANYLSRLLPLVSEREYLDYSKGPAKAVRRLRLIDVGCDMAKLFSALDVNNILEPAPTVHAINEAIETASKRGGIVRPKPGDLDIGSSRIVIKDSVILDMSRVPVNMIGKEHTRAVHASTARDWAVTGLTVEGNERGVYAVRVENFDNYLIQLVKTSNMDQNSISTKSDCTKGTIRYCIFDLVRDEAGGGEYRKQHGITSNEISGTSKSNPAKAPVPSPRFGNVYATGMSCYSNLVYGAEGLALDLHTSNLEVCGNYFFNCGYGVKFPHAANILYHHNHADGNDNTHHIIFRLYSANDYAEGVGYTGDKIFVFLNTFSNISPESVIRLDLIGGTRHFMNNMYVGASLPEFSVTQSENKIQKGDFDGVLYRYGQDSELPVQRHNGAKSSDIRIEANVKLQQNDHHEMIRLMNLQKDPKWAAHVDHPLPVVAALEA